MFTTFIPHSSCEYVHRIALVVLLNVARFKVLAVEVAEVVDCCESLVDLLQMFRDKKALFILAAELLSRLVDASSALKVSVQFHDLTSFPIAFLQTSCNSPVLRKRLEGIQHIMERKNRLEVRVKSVGDSKFHTVCGEMPAPNKPSCQFDKYKGKAYKLIEPVHCIQHLMELLKPE